MLYWMRKFKTAEDNQLQPRKDTREKTTTPLSYITYLFLKDLIVGDVLAIVFLLALLSQENLYSSPRSVIKCLFTGIDSSSHAAVSSAQVIYWFLSSFFLFIYSIVIANIYLFFSNRSLETFITDSVFRVSLVLPLWQSHCIRLAPSDLQ